MAPRKSKRSEIGKAIAQAILISTGSIMAKKRLPTAEMDIATKVLKLPRNFITI